MELDKLKLKTSSQLLPEEKAFVKEHVSELNDEDKAAYADFLQEDIELSSEGEEGASDTGNGEGEGDKKDDQANGEPAKPAQFQFNSEQEAIDFVRTIQEKDAAAKQAALESAKTPAEKKYVDDNWKAPSWNEAMRLAVQFAKEEIKADQNAETEQQRTDAKRLETEWQQISKEHSIPALDTQEGRSIHNQIVNLALKHNKETFTDAYELWAHTASEFGGGYKPSPSDAGAALADAKKKQVDTQKKVAAKVGGQNQGTNQRAVGDITAPTYKELHEARSVHDLIKKAGVLHG